MSRIAIVKIILFQWMEAMREGGNSLLNSTNEATTGSQHNRFETSIEDFYATLDQIELNLKCAAETTGQSQASSR